jgi:hypothetical protein
MSIIQANPLYGKRKYRWIPLGVIVALVIAVFCHRRAWHAEPASHGTGTD